jgi:Mrp family chromosome partitioning ATPase
VVQAREPVVSARVVEVSAAEEQAFAQTFVEKDVETPPHLVSPDVVARLQETHEPGRAIRVLVTSATDEGNAQEIAVETARTLSHKGRAILVAVGDDLVSLPEEDVGDARLGLTDLLTGEASFAEVIHRDARSSLHFIPAGRASYRGLDGFDLVLDALCHTYDFIVLATPEAAEKSDAIRLASQVDSVMLATSGRSSDEAATKTYGDLVDAGARDVLLVGRDSSAEQTAA